MTEPSLGRAMRDAGHEVVFLGPDNTPEQVAATAVQEDVDLVALTEATDADRITALLAELDVDDIDVTVFTPDQARALR